MLCLNGPHHFKFFGGCLPQILLGRFLECIVLRIMLEIQNTSVTQRKGGNCL